MSNKEKKVVCILDEFSYQCFKYECNLILITPDNWREIITLEKPDILLVESYWSGNDGVWKNPNKEHLQQLILMVKYCKSINIPTVFWNKEDPYSFNIFIRMARYFDIVYTTDISCINKYKEILNHENIYLLTFAAQTTIHNPIEVYKERKNKISFAGTYYAKKFLERQNDFKLIADVAINYGLDIYDRHYSENNEQVAYPEKYKDKICGKLQGEEIVKAYKEYKFSINLNSIKDSPTMFARRVPELMASNTVVISSYSKGMIEFFGDLNIHDKNKTNLNYKVNKLINEELTYKKYRLLGLRKVLQYHTYADRFADIMEKSLNIKCNDKWDSVAVIGFVDDIDSINRLKYKFIQQKYENKKLYIFSTFEFNENKEKNIYNINQINGNLVKEIIKEHYISFFHEDDFYGSHYLTDLMSATLYASKCHAIGKSSYYSINPKLELNINDGEYRFVKSLMYRNSIIKTININHYNMKQFYKILNNKFMKEESMLSIDCFNYLYNGNINANKEDIEVVLDIEDVNIGKSIEEIEKQYFESDNLNPFINIYKLNLDKFISSDTSQVILQDIENNNLLINSNLTNNKHEYIYYNIKHSNFEKIPMFTPINLNFENEYIITSFGEKQTNQNVSIVIIGYSKYKKESVHFIPLNSSKIVSFDKNIEKIMVCIRIQEYGNLQIEGISIKERKKNFLEESNSDYLILTNNYPSDDDLYKNAFIHRRVKNYIECGLNVDVFAFNYYEKDKFTKYKFEEVNVFKGYKDQLRNLLNNSSYKKILIHFFNIEMYDVIKEFESKLDIIIWLHGAEVRPWYRRYFDYDEDIVLTNIISSSNKRMDFMRSIFVNSSPNIYFVFISEIFKKEVEADLGLQLDSERYSIIHNVIDEELFVYNEKNIEHRKKILSIRPFASRTYANDLSVLAIIELSKRKYFNQLEICFYGEGKLFEETMEQLKKFKNIKIYEKFLTQVEIAKVHKEYGIFLVPTRNDSQGVSRDEAMLSGLVPITNKVSAIPEFVDDKCAMLVESEDYIGLANAIEYLYFNPNEFTKKSENASKHVKQISGKNDTIYKEINLIKSKNKFEFVDKCKLELDKFNSPSDKQIKLDKINNNSIEINSFLSKDSHQYIYYNVVPNNFLTPPLYTPINIDKNKEYLFESSASKSKNATLAIIAYSKEKKEKLYFIPLNQSHIITFDENIEAIMICIRVQGECTFDLNYIKIKDRNKFSGIKTNLMNIQDIQVEPKVSVLIAAYNVEKYINEALNSIINQTIGFENIEVIIIDDASNDNTPNILDSYAKKYKQITVAHNKERQRYPGKVRNQALTLAKGKYVMILDSDDIMNKDACITMYNLMETYKSDYIIGKYSYLYEENNKVQPAVIFESDKYTKSTINFSLESLYNKENLTGKGLTVEDVIKHPGTSCNKIFNREFLINNNIQYRDDQVTGEDYILNNECLLKASKISYFPVDVFYYRRRNDPNNKSITQNFDINIINDLMKQKIRTSNLYRDSKYPFDDITNQYFLSILYYKILEIKNYPNDKLISILENIRANLNLFNLEDKRLSLHAINVFKNILNRKYDTVFKLIR